MTLTIRNAATAALLGFAALLLALIVPALFKVEAKAQAGYTGQYQAQSQEQYQNKGQYQGQNQLQYQYSPSYDYNSYDYPFSYIDYDNNYCDNSCNNYCDNSCNNNYYRYINNNDDCNHNRNYKTD